MAGVGIVGVGFMGMIHYLALQKVAGSKVVALCSRDANKLAGDWTSIQGNFGPRGGMMDLSGLGLYPDVAGLLADPNVDLVDLCVPNDGHAKMAIRALEAGKHVLVEKPIALTTADADAMVAAAKANGRLLMVAHVLPFFPEFAFAADAVRSGRYGKLKAAHFTRVIAKPDWSAGIADADRSGGPAVDLHIHDTHFIALVCGVPKAVQTRGIVDGGAVVHLLTQYLYDDPNYVISAECGAITQAGRSFKHGYEIYLEGATLSFEFAVLGGAGHVATPVSVILPDGTVERPDLGSGDPIDAFAAELGLACRAADSGVEAADLAGGLARRALVLCHAEMESVRTGRPIDVS